jgi:hypothetical protein
VDSRVSVREYGASPAVPGPRLHPNFAAESVVAEYQCGQYCGVYRARLKTTLRMRIEVPDVTLCSSIAPLVEQTKCKLGLLKDAPIWHGGFQHQ